MPNFAAGSTTLYMVCHLVAPIAKLASRMPMGIELSASMVRVVIVGTIMMASTNHAVSAPKPKPLSLIHI